MNETKTVNQLLVGRSPIRWLREAVKALTNEALPDPSSEALGQWIADRAKAEGKAYTLQQACAYVLKNYKPISLKGLAHTFPVNASATSAGPGGASAAPSAPAPAIAGLQGLQELLALVERVGGIEPLRKVVDALYPAPA